MISGNWLAVIFMCGSLMLATHTCVQSVMHWGNQLALADKWLQQFGVRGWTYMENKLGTAYMEKNVNLWKESEYLDE